MKLGRSLSTTAIATGLITSAISILPLHAVNTSEENIDQSQVVVVAVPFGNNRHNLVVVEQIPGKDKCWKEIGSQPTVIDPLWTSFDFTGHCRRATDSNGYSVRLDGQDTSHDYLLSLVESDQDIKLVALNREDRSRTVIGRTLGTTSDDFLKIYLNPGWQLTKKKFEDKVLSHFFFSGNTEEITSGVENLSPSTPVRGSF